MKLSQNVRLVSETRRHDWFEFKNHAAHIFSENGLKTATVAARCELRRQARCVLLLGYEGKQAVVMYFYSSAVHGTMFVEEHKLDRLLLLCS